MTRGEVADGDDTGRVGGRDNTGLGGHRGSHDRAAGPLASSVALARTTAQPRYETKGPAEAGPAEHHQTGPWGSAGDRDPFRRGGGPQRGEEGRELGMVLAAGILDGVE